MATLTLLAACNEVLLNVGEMEVNDLTSPVAKKARMAVLKSLRTVANMHNWSYLKTVVSTASWVNGVATLVPVQDIYSVTLNNLVLSSVDEDTLYEYAKANSGTGGTPEMYARVGENQVMVYPEPSPTDKPLVLFRVMLQASTPTLALDQFTMPDDVYDIVGTFAEYLMHRNHTTDSAAMGACLQEFELRLHMLRSRDNSQLTANIGGYTT